MALHRICKLEDKSPHLNLCEELDKKYGGSAFFVDNPYTFPELCWREESCVEQSAQLFCLLIEAFVNGWFAQAKSR